MPITSPARSTSAPPELPGLIAALVWIADGSVGRACGLLRLPEDRLASLHLGEDELGTRKPRPVEQQIDRRSAPSAETDRCLLDDLGVLRPCVLKAVAVDARGGGQALARLQHQPVLERQPQ